MKKESNSDYLNGLSAQHKQEIVALIKEEEKDRENGISSDWVKINFQGRDFKIGLGNVKKNKIKSAVYTGSTNIFFTNGSEYKYKLNSEPSNSPTYTKYLFVDNESFGDFSHSVDEHYFKDNFEKVKKGKNKGEKTKKAISLKSDPEFFTKGYIYKFKKQPDGFYCIEDNISDGMIDHMFTEAQFKRNFVVIKKGKKQHD